MKKHIRLITAITAIFLMFSLLAGCTPSGNTNSSTNTMFTLDTYPRMDGSTANLPLMAQYLSTTCGIPLEEAEMLVSVSTTQSAWDNLAYGNVDILIVYEASDDTIHRIQHEYGNFDITPIGRDGLVFLVNEDNPLNSLTQNQLVSIYTGEVTNWAEVGGEDLNIVAFQRVDGSGSQTMFLKLLMQGTEPMEAPTELTPGGMGGLIEMLSSFDGSAPAIGYSVYYYVSEMNQDPNLKLLQVDGVAPTNETLADGSYPLINDFYVVIRSDEPEGSPARMLRDWILSEEGMQELIDAGYVPVR